MFYLKLILLFRSYSLKCRSVITKEEFSNGFLILSDHVAFDMIEREHILVYSHFSVANAVPRAGRQHRPGFKG